MLGKLIKRTRNILRFGLGEGARERKRAAKTAAREARFDSTLWAKDGEIARRQYGSYEEYLEHQAAKLDNIAHRLEETRADDYADFVRRFEGCAALGRARNVLCLGARLGTEVQAMHSLGLFAVGIDLNPGPDNCYVMKGDFHAIVFPDGSVDAVYTNVFDHVYDFSRLMAEIERLLRPGGVLVADVLKGFEEGFTPGAYEATHWKSVDALLAELLRLSKLKLVERRDLGQVRRDHWIQLVLEKPQPQ
jgi:SAM-dependent methyltransferase